MRRSVSRVLFLVGFALMALGVGVVIFSGVASGNRDPVHLALADATLYLVPIGAALCTVAWIGALVRTAQLRRWGWFIALLLLNITLFIYIFEGPDDPP